MPHIFKDYLVVPRSELLPTSLSTPFYNIMGMNTPSHISILTTKSSVGVCGASVLLSYSTFSCLFPCASILSVELAVISAGLKALYKLPSGKYTIFSDLRSPLKCPLHPF